MSRSNWSADPEKVKGKSYGCLGGVFQAERPASAEAWRMGCAGCSRNSKEASEANVESGGERGRR